MAASRDVERKAPGPGRAPAQSPARKDSFHEEQHRAQRDWVAEAPATDPLRVAGAKASITPGQQKHTRVSLRGRSDYPEAKDSMASTPSVFKESGHASSIVTQSSVDSVVTMRKSSEEGSRPVASAGRSVSDPVSRGTEPMDLVKVFPGKVRHQSDTAMFSRDSTTQVVRQTSIKMASSHSSVTEQRGGGSVRLRSSQATALETKRSTSTNLVSRRSLRQPGGALGRVDAPQLDIFRQGSIHKVTRRFLR